MRFSDEGLPFDTIGQTRKCETAAALVCSPPTADVLEPTPRRVELLFEKFLRQTLSREQHNHFVRLSRPNAATLRCEHF
jgi:hypothetical protein